MGDGVFELVEAVGELEVEEGDSTSELASVESTLKESKDSPAEVSQVSPMEAAPKKTDRPKSVSLTKPRRKSNQREGSGKTSLIESRRTLSKAKVQATARYDVRLYAEYETWQESLQERGETTPSFTEVQNQALDLWLQKNVR